MDANGARDLARLLEERSGSSTPALRPSPLANAEAAPIFRWLGIEPPAAVAAEGVDAAGSAG